jgi:(p)ppGpp synthase/HD superfamily hydrolase
MLRSWIRQILTFDESITLAIYSFFRHEVKRNEVRMGMECRVGSRFSDALLYAVEIHGADRRKGTSIPYVSHLLSVCALVMEDGGDEDEAIAALLHDTLEDHPEKVTKSDLSQRFGPRVVSLVELCTDTPPDYQGGPKPPWYERKTAYVERIRKETYPLCRVALADKIHNTRNIVMDYRRFGNSVWSRFKANREEQLRYYKALVLAFREAQSPRHLVDELDSLVSELEK